MTQYLFRLIATRTLTRNRPGLLLVTQPELGSVVLRRPEVARCVRHARTTNKVGIVDRGISHACASCRVCRSFGNGARVCELHMLRKGRP